MNTLKSFEVEILRLVYGGDGLARLPDGRAVFVPFTLPGEIVRIRLLEEKKNFARGWMEALIKPSPLRITPRCIHFGICGGCQYQHLSYEEQLKVKQAVFTEQLVRIAGLSNPPVRPIVASPEPWYYRSELQFHISEDGKPGFIRADEFAVLEIQECHLPMSGIGSTWPQLDFEAEPSIERVELLQGSDDEILLTLQGADELPEMELDLPVSVVYRLADGDIIMAGDSYILMRVKDRVFSVSASSFFQVNTYLVPRLVDEVLTSLDLNPALQVLDLYCGVGLFSAFLAPHVGQLISIEQSESACQDFAVNLDALENVTLYQGAVEDVLPGLDVHPDILIVDPPRSGLDRRVLDDIIRKSPTQLVYVSCDPSTFARDVKRLSQAGYHLNKVTPLDLYPQTYHVECVALMSKAEVT